MTVTTTKSSKTFAGNGVTQAFSCDFRIFQAADVVVKLIVPGLGTSVTLALNTDYTISGANADAGFVVTTIAAVPAGQNLLVSRRIPFTQPTSFTNQGQFFPSLHQDMADRLEMQVQQLAGDIGRALTLPEGITANVSTDFPFPTPGGLVGWSSDGLSLVNIGPIDPTDISIINEQTARQNADAAISGRINGYNGLPISTNVGLYTALQNNPALDVSGSLSTPEQDGALSTYFDNVMRGSGRVTGIYRKNVIPFNAPPFSFSANDLLPKHVPQLNTAAQSGNPVVVLVGDSISTYYANSNANVQAMLTEVLRTEIRQQISPKDVNFYDRGIGGTTYTDLDGIPSLSVYPEWYTNTANSWLSYIQSLNPDLVVFSFGMNPHSGIRTAIDSIMAKIGSWTKVPDRVFCTNLVPNPATGFNSIEEQEARDRSAGLIRSYARRNGFGLLDFHRAMCMARDGFDPTKGYIQQRNPLTKVAGSFVSNTYSTLGFSAQLVIDSTKIPAQGATYQPVTVKYGYGSEESIHIYKDIASGQYRIRLYYGNVVYGDASVQQIDQQVTLNNIGGQLVVKVERYDTHIAVFDMVGAYNSGENRDPVFEAKLISMGGRFQFSAAGTQTDALISCDFGQGFSRLNVPCIKSGDLFGRPVSPNPNGEFGGSGFNHPSSLVADMVYRPVLAVAKFADANVRMVGASLERYMANINGNYVPVTRYFGRLAVTVTAAGTFNWTTPLASTISTKVLSARASLGSLPGTTTVSIFNNTSYGGISIPAANATGSYTTTSTSGTLLIDWEVVGY